jgi:hypothetical protein
VHGDETGVVIISAAGSADWGSLEPASGPNYIAIEGSGCYAESTITQLTPGVEYEVRFMTACQPGGHGDETLSVKIDGGALTDCRSAVLMVFWCSASGYLLAIFRKASLLDAATCIALRSRRVGIDASC